MKSIETPGAGVVRTIAGPVLGAEHVVPTNLAPMYDRREKSKRRASNLVKNDNEILSVIVWLRLKLRPPVTRLSETLKWVG